jgi:hypothetical protein
MANYILSNESDILKYIISDMLQVHKLLNSSKLSYTLHIIRRITVNICTSREQR